RSSFNGTVQLTLFDHPTKVTTSGRNNPPFSFNQTNNALFRGQASVVNGKFETEFILPSGIPSTVGLGKLSLYAFDPATLADASGGIATVKIGGKESASITDNEGPEIEMFM